VGKWRDHHGFRQGEPVKSDGSDGVLDDFPTDLRKEIIDKLETLASESKLTEADRAQVWEALLALVRRHHEFPDADGAGLPMRV